MVTFDQAKAVKKDFCMDYMKEPYDVNSCGIGKDGSDYCLRYCLRKPLLPGVVIPAVYKGVKAIHVGMGEIRAL
ncbi:MAG: hypothetical protein UW30_C0013G0007 [Candidatus Giovannonibacteria bacterium GW2011_GWA2_44_13b]|uniref:Uncharacterized protein n=1 Tax=Candidatus Giovannonibacteria bacterium GW2011_GWA2_44_13b TaxID=1618647 RepID=A0A0G1H3F2_9BACT|nr:MAG: hypothetical protein UW30_C0013G0007 [Candidatus Giovannonibacteria bacterium GW2011_GWA2_44_13b]